jgi:hypothetical protein
MFAGLSSCDELSSTIGRTFSDLMRGLFILIRINRRHPFSNMIVEAGQSDLRLGRRSLPRHAIPASGSCHDWAACNESGAP